jgi:hypothetical protein
MLAPTVTGTLEELERHLKPSSEEKPDRSKSSPPSYEGWIVTTLDGTNTKWVTPSYMRASTEASRLHPLAVWDRVRTGGENMIKMMYGSGLSLHHSEELSKILDALQAAYSARGTGEPTHPVSMYYDKSNEFLKYGHMRSIILDKIKPSLDGSLQGYTPSTGCMLTIAKGWVGGVRIGRMSGYVPLIHAKLSNNSILGLVLEALQGVAMANAILVNKEWACIIRSAPGFKEKVMSLMLGCTGRGSDFDFWSDDGDDSGSWRDYYDNYRGYGSR